MKSIHLQLFSICFLLIFFSCKKEAGQGGTSFINGKVYAKYYDKKFYILTDSAYAPGVEVYIIYGNESSYGDHQKTNYDGTYEFKYLRVGSYKIYAYSKDSTGMYKNQVNLTAPTIAIIKNADITKKKQTIEVPDINILQ